MVYRVIARQYGNSVEFEVHAEDTKEALHKARTEANKIFDYGGLGDEPTVNVKKVS